MQKTADSLSPKYQAMLNGVRITPEQDKTLRDLYNRAMIPVNPGMLVFMGALATNMIFCLYSLAQYEKTHNKELFMWVMAAALAQFVGLSAYAYKKHKVEKQLRNTIDEIKKQNRR